MSGVGTEQIAAGLWRRGVDARTFVDGDEPGGQGHRGAAVHGICVLGWRYCNGRWEFTDRPPRLMEPDEHDPSGRWIWDDILSDCCRPAVAASDQVQVVVGRVAELLALDPSQPCSQCFADFRAWDAMCGDSAQAPDRRYPQWCDHSSTELRPGADRAGYTPDTARLADHMCSPRAVVQCVDTAGLGHRSTASHQISRCIRYYSIGCVTFICEPTSTWAQIGHTADPVDWPALIAEMHLHLGWDNQRLDSEHGADSSAALQRVQSEPRLEVTLNVGPDARILVFPTAVAVSASHHPGGQNSD